MAAFRFQPASILSVLSTILTLAACTPTANFTLPAPDAAGPSGPFVWSADAKPVIERGAATDVLNPSVVRFKNQYWNFYSEFDGSVWHTALATSDDGTHWLKQGRLLSPAFGDDSITANGSVLTDGPNPDNPELWYFFQTGQPAKIALTRSADGKNWSREPAPILEPGPKGSFDEAGVADPYVIRAGDALYLFYLGQDLARRQRLGVARSTDGVHWTRSRANPILDLGEPSSFDENGLGEPAVWTSGGSWWMLYTGRARNEQRRLGLAQSPDGISWNRVPGFPPVDGPAPWASQVICDPTVLLEGDTVRVWFGGGTIARPDENLNGQIGLARLTRRP